MNSIRRLPAVLAATAATLLAPSNSRAQTATTDPAAILKEASAALAAHPKFRLAATVLYKGKFQGSEEEIPTTINVAFERPDRVSVHIENSKNDVFIYRDAKDFTRYVPAFKQYIVEPQTMSAQEIIGMSGFELIAPAMGALAEVAAAAPFSGPFAPQSPKYVGREDVNGHPCDRVHFTTAQRSYDAWVDAAPARLVRRIEPDMAPEEAKYAQQYGTTFDFTVVASLDTWDFDTDLSKAVAFVSPEGTQKVAAFTPPRQKSPAEEMAGSPAPDFTLPLLTGGQVSLAKLKGDVVVLDFWATWCGPCREGLPVIQQLSEEYSGKGAKIFAVNQGDEMDAIKAFLTENKLDKLPVLLDAERNVGELFKVNGIPETVIISTDGKIHAVHIGIPNDPAVTGAATTQEEFTKLLRQSYAKSLRAELDPLLHAK